MTIYTSPLPAIRLRRQSITERLFEGLGGDPARIVLIDGPGGAAMSAGTLEDRIRRLAGGLQARGIGPGAVVAVFAPNAPDFAVAFHGVAFAGATVTTLNPSYTAHEVQHQLRDSGACLLLTLPALLPVALAALHDTAVTEVVTFTPAEGHATLDDLLGAPLAAQVPVDLAGHAVALPYSSGTTGLPKGVRLSHRNLVANVDQVHGALNIRPGDMSVAFLPFFHIYGMNTLMNAFLARGAGLVCMPRFDLEAFLGHVQRHRSRLVLIAPPVAVALAKHPLVGDFDLSSLEVLMSGAAPLGAELAAAVGARLGCTLLQGYGMTEMSPVSHIVPESDPRPGRVGLTVPDTECRLVDPATGQDAPAGGEGELWVRGPQVMLGYHNAPEATAATLTADGWLKTGDLAAFDADGQMVIRDRLKELIKVSGFQVAPAEVEADLLTHPDIADAAVIGVPDEAAGERPVALLVPRAGHVLHVEELAPFLAEQLASYKRPREIRLVAAIPKSASGKILRRVLKAEYLAGKTD